MSDFNDRLQHLLLDMTFSINRLKVFLSTTRASVLESRRRIENEAGDFLHSLHSDGLIDLSEVDINPSAWARICKDQAKNVIRNCTTVTEAAALVFAHSLLDIAVSECLDILIDAAPLKWSDQVKDKKVTLEQITSNGAEALICAEVMKHKQQLKRMSITARIEALHRFCRPKRSYVVHKTSYVYDAERISVLDIRRHGIIHEADITVGNFDLDKEIEYIERTCIYLCMLVGDAIPIQWDLDRILPQYLASGAKSRSDRKGRGAKTG